MNNYDVAIVGAGPGGLACAIKAVELGLSYVLIEKGQRVFQGIIDTYPGGKKVYATIPKGEEGPFPMEALAPIPDEKPVEEYINQIENLVDTIGIQIQFGQDFQDVISNKDFFEVTTRDTSYRARNAILAFGSNIPIDLNVYGEAKTIARRLDNPEDHIGTPTLVLGGGNAAADVVSTLSKAKRAANDPTSIYWGNRRETFKVNKTVARDLGEEILLGGNIKIMHGAIPRIGEVDEDGVERLTIQTRRLDKGGGVELTEGMSFPMKHVIACIGTQGPAPVYDRLKLQQITCTGGICKIGKEGAQLIMLTPSFRTSKKGIYAIGGAISPAYILSSGDGSFMERKHSNLIFTAIRDAKFAMDDIAKRSLAG